MPGWLTNGAPNIATNSLTGAEQIPVDTESVNGQSPQSGYITTGALGLGVQTIAAAGASQGTATQITGLGGTVFVTVTASTEGVKLPSINSPGMRFLVLPSTTVGVKVYAGVAGQTIGTATTATTAVTVALNKSTQFIAVSATKWRVLASA